MKLKTRLTVELRNRGAAGFLQFLVTRLIQWRSDVLYEFDLPDLIARSTLEPAIPVVLVERLNLGNAETRNVEADVLTLENHAYREALKGEDILLALTDQDGRVTSYGFVLFDSFYKRILDEDRITPMISNCFTLPAWRGQGLYSRLLVATCQQLSCRGYRRAIITCAPYNTASVRGIERAGARRVAILHSLVVGSRWIAWQRRLPGMERKAVR